MISQVHATPLPATVVAVGARRMFDGVGAGVAQKFVTRGPMFLASEVCSQACMCGLGLSRERAVFVGSACSGYVLSA